MTQLFHVLGAGSIGCLFSYHMAKSGWPVTLLLRGEALRTFEGAGCQVRCGDGAAECGAEQVDAAGHDGQQRQPAGAPIRNLLVTTKASQTAAAVSAVSHRLDGDSVVILLQNGVLGVYEELLSQGFPDPSARPRFLLGSTTHGAWRRGPFQVEWYEGAAVFGRPMPCGARGGGGGGMNGGGGHSSASGQQQQQQQQQWDSGSSSGRAEEVLQLLGSPDLAPLRIDATLTPEQMHEQLLSKLLINACANPLAALLHCRNGGLLGNEPARRIMAAVAAECKAALGDLSGADGGCGSSGGGESVAGGGLGSGGGGGPGLQGTEAELLRRVEGVLSATAGNCNSMLQDTIKGIPTEINYLNGYVVRRAAARGVPAPVNSLLMDLIMARDACPQEHKLREQLR